MKTKNRAIFLRTAPRLAIIIAAAIILSACPSETTIGRLSADPGRYFDREVALAGVVTNSYGALNFGAYELSDETGRIWVLTERGVPARGARVRTVGLFVGGATWGGQSYGNALRETDRKR